MLTKEEITVAGKKTKKRRSKKKHKGLLLFIKTIFFVALVITALTLLALSPWFEVASIKVVGNDHYTSERVIAAAAVTEGINGFKYISGSPMDIITLRSKKAEQSVEESCPYIKKAEIRFVPPSELIIKVEERTPAFTLPYMGTSLIIDREGYVIDTVKDPLQANLPQVTGIELSSFKMGGALVTSNKEGLDNVLELIETVNRLDNEKKLNLFDSLKKIDAGDNNNFYIFIGTQLSVNLGDLSELEYRLLMTSEILKKGIKKTDRGLLDFTSGDDPVFKPDTANENTTNKGDLQ